MKQLFLMAAFSVAIAFSAAAQDSTAVRHHQGHGAMMAQQQQRMKTALNLTDQQSQQLKDLHKTYAAKMKAIRSNTSLTDAQKKEQFKTLRTQQQVDFKNVLTKDQQDKLAQMHQNFKKKGGERLAARGDHFKKALNLTDQQSQQLKDLNKTYGAKAKDIRSNTALNADQKKAQFKALHEQRKADFNKVLTKDQQDKLAQMMQHRKHRRTKVETPDNKQTGDNSQSNS